MTLGRRLIPLLFIAWLLGVALVVAAYAKGYGDIAAPVIGLACMLAALLLVAPPLLFLLYAWRSPANVPHDMRRSALMSGAANLVGGIVLAVTVKSLELGMFPYVGNLPVIGAIAVSAVGLIVVIRVFTLGPPPPPPVDSAGVVPRLRHRVATTAGVGTILVAAFLARGASGQPSFGPNEANMRSDLRNLVAAQDEFQVEHRRYGSMAELSTTGRPYKPDLSQADIVLRAESTRFIATASSPKTRLSCLVWSGAPPPPADSVHGAEDGVPACWQR
jgi:hypothetical protein